MLRANVDKGLVWAQRQLAAAYDDGQVGLPQSHKKAAPLYEQAAAQGDAPLVRLRPRRDLATLRTRAEAVCRRLGSRLLDMSEDLAKPKCNQNVTGGILARE